MDINKAARLIINSSKTIAFTGAGISVESGIPPFRGDGGLWSQYNPLILDLNYYIKNHSESWPVIKKLFYDFFDKSKPNTAHYILADWEERGFLTGIITQNIDHLHQKAGGKNIIEFHGTSQSFICTQCKNEIQVTELNLTKESPKCSLKNCNGLLKPNFIFFGENIPELAY